MPTLLERPTETSQRIPRGYPAATVESRVVYVSDIVRPVTFEDWVEISSADEEEFELRDGILVKRMAAQYTHETMFRFLFTTFSMIADRKKLGVVLGSRTPVKITEFRGRLPDVLFVRADRASIVEEKAVRGAPDLVIEIVSPNDGADDILERETDYRQIGVREIVLLNPQTRTARILRKGETATESALDYDEENLNQPEDVVRFMTFDAGLTLTLDELFTLPHPPLDTLLNRAAGGNA